MNQVSRTGLWRNGPQDSCGNDEATHSESCWSGKAHKKVNATVWGWVGLSLGKRKGGPGSGQAAGRAGRSPVDARTLNAQGDAQVDASPAGVCQATVTAQIVASNALDPLERTLPFQQPLLGVSARLWTSHGRGRIPLHLLEPAETTATDHSHSRPCRKAAPRMLPWRALAGLEQDPCPVFLAYSSLPPARPR